MSAQATEHPRSRNSKFRQKFKQQRLPAWQPILTAGTVLPAFFLIGLVFIPLGIALLYFSQGVQELTVPYTQCLSNEFKLANGDRRTCYDVLDEDITNLNCTCDISFNITETFEGKVYMYYGLENFYQNHRRYVKSRDDNQLLGRIGEVSSDCAPFHYYTNDTAEYTYAPCGAIANSFFNDSLSLWNVNPVEEVPLLNKDIAWASDRNVRFNNPPGSLTDPTADDFAFKDTIKPPYWRQNVWQLDVNDETNNGYQNEDLIVWMRTAAFPTFRKLYRRIDHDQQGYRNGLSKGEYILKIKYNYPVHAFSGKKRMILSTTSFLGGKNDFLGIAYITVGSVCLLLGIIFLIIHIKYGKRPSEHFNINQNTPYTE